jgi:hypothetical protein
MDETDQPEHKAEICEQLYHEVPALLEFHYSVVATLFGVVEFEFRTQMFSSIASVSRSGRPGPLLTSPSVFWKVVSEQVSEEHQERYRQMLALLRARDRSG